jgi:hypothetical protein
MGPPETSISQYEPHIEKLFCERTTAAQNFFQMLGSCCENNLSARCIFAPDHPMADIPPERVQKERGFAG